MSDVNNDYWYIYENGIIRILTDKAKKFGITLDHCLTCNYGIVNNSYQNSTCGSRMCAICYSKAKSNYYCEICKIENPEKYVHSKMDMFLDKAYEKDLQKLKIICPDCKEESISLLNLEKHILDCSKKWLPCYQCGKVYQKDAKIHICIANYKKRKPYQIVKDQCQSCGGEYDFIKNHVCLIDWSSECPYECTVENKQIEENHRSDFCVEHLNKIWDIMMVNNLNKIPNKGNTDFYSTILKRVSMEFKDDKFELLEKEMKLLRTELKNEAEAYDNLQNNITEKIQERFFTCFDGTILWRIDNWSKHFEQARSKKETSVFSQPFYTSRFGNIGSIHKNMKNSEYVST